MDAKAYFENVVLFHGPTISAAENIRALVKWIFDLLRNLIILGLLQYLATKSGSSMLLAMSTCGHLLLLIYLFSYIDTWTLRPFHPMQNKKVAAILNMAASAIVLVTLWWCMIFGLQTAVNEVARAQGA